MAKAFSDSERETIRDRLCAAAESCLGGRGIRKTSVEELAAAARISKGAFYLFYRTKEELFFDVIMRRHEEIEGALVEKFSKIASPTSSDLADLILEFFRSTSESFFPKFLASGELELLMRRLPPELSENHLRSDAEMTGRLLSLMPGMSSAAAERYAAAFRAIFLLLLHRDEIGQEYFDGTLELLVRGVVDRMYDEMTEAGK
jgi:AcrR family transcriptional regulator